jgi:acetyl esterase/lipase
MGLRGVPWGPITKPGVAARCALIGLGAWAGAALAQPAGPPPATLSEAGRAAMTAMAKAPQPPEGDVAARRRFLDRFQQDFGAGQAKRYAVDIQASTMAGVPVRLIKPRGAPAPGNLVLLNVHGGGFNADSGSLTENIPIAALTRIPVVAVLYRLAPEHPYPAAVDDALAVYKELLKTHKPAQIGLYGTSAGAILGPELVARLKTEGLPPPAVLGVFSGDADFAHHGDTVSSLPGASSDALYKGYLGPVPPTDPIASPSLGPVEFFPPTLCLSSSRDFFLSPTANFCRRLDLAGVENKLVVWDGLPHAFWAYMAIPESDEAFGVMAKWLGGHLRGR